MERELSIVMWEHSLVIWSAPSIRWPLARNVKDRELGVGCTPLVWTLDRQVKSPLDWYGIRWLTGGPWPKERGPLIFIWGPSFIIWSALAPNVVIVVIGICESSLIGWVFLGTSTI